MPILPETGKYAARGPEKREAGATVLLCPGWRDRAVLTLQLLATAAVLGWVPGNFSKLAAMIVVWAIGFRRMSRAEIAMMAGIDVIFVSADLGALHHQIFHFSHPDLMGMPVYEYFLWGFYVLHTIRWVGGPYPHFRPFPTVILAAAFAVTFATITNPDLLLSASAAVLVLALLFFHEGDDFLYIGYMIAIGAVIEYVGTGTGQWAYPAALYGGVPAWFVTMWGGVGLLTRRLALPLLARVRQAMVVV
jgi:hypothetical protein